MHMRAHTCELNDNLLLLIEVGVLKHILRPVVTKNEENERFKN